MSKNKVLFVIGILVLVLVVGGALFLFQQNEQKQDLIGASQKELSLADSPLELAITRFAEEKLLWEAEGLPFCGTQVVWEYPLSDEEGVVYTGLSCAMVIVQNNDLRGTAGFSQEMLLKVRKDNDSWTVVDYDERITPQQTPAPWVAEYLGRIPEEVESKIDMWLVLAKLLP